MKPKLLASSEECGLDNGGSPSPMAHKHTLGHSSISGRTLPAPLPASLLSLPGSWVLWSPIPHLTQSFPWDKFSEVKLLGPILLTLCQPIIKFYLNLKTNPCSISPLHPNSHSTNLGPSHHFSFSLQLYAKMMLLPNCFLESQIPQIPPIIFRLNSANKEDYLLWMVHHNSISHFLFFTFKDILLCYKH